MFGLHKSVPLYFSTVQSVIDVKQTVVDRQTHEASFLLLFSYRYPEIAISKCFSLFFVWVFFGGRFLFLALTYFAVQRAALGCQSENQSQKSCVTDAGILLGRLVFQASLGVQAISRRA